MRANLSLRVEMASILESKSFGIFENSANFSLAYFFIISSMFYFLSLSLTYWERILPALVLSRVVSSNLLTPSETTRSISVISVKATDSRSGISLAIMMQLSYFWDSLLQLRSKNYIIRLYLSMVPKNSWSTLLGIKSSSSHASAGGPPGGLKETFWVCLLKP